MTARKIRTKIVWLLLLCLMGGCTSSPIDQDLIGDETCVPPCWMGIKPGETSVGDAIEILERMREESKGQFTILEMGYIEWRNTSGENYTLYSEGDLLKYVRLHIQFTTVAEAISLLGEPSHVVLGEVDNGGYIMSVFYPSKGISLLVNGHEKEFEIKPDMPVIRATFLKPTNDIEEMLKYYYHSEDETSATLTNIKEWKGYGIVYP